MGAETLPLLTCIFVMQTKNASRSTCMCHPDMSVTGANTVATTAPAASLSTLYRTSGTAMSMHHAIHVGLNVGIMLAEAITNGAKTTANTEPACGMGLREQALLQTAVPLEPVGGCHQCIRNAGLEGSVARVFDDLKTGFWPCLVQPPG